MLGGDLSITDNQGIPIISNTIALKFKRILQNCLVYDPSRRSTALDIKLFYLSPRLFLNHVTNFYLPSSYNHSALSVGVIPNSVEDLNLRSYNHDLSVGVIPNSVKRLNLSSYNYSALTVGVIPKGVENLDLSSYNHSALTVGVIPKGVENLDLSSYNHSALEVGVIPNSVWNLNLLSYNHSALTVGIIPKGVRYLYLRSYNYSALTVGVIPNSVWDLYLRSYNHSALSVGVIPNSVINIKLSSYNHSALSVGVIPNRVIDLDLSSYNHSALTVGVIPNSVEDLNLSSYNHPLSVGVIPNSVQQLSFNKFNQYIEYDAIPSSVTSLDLGEEFELSSNGQDLPSESINRLKCSFDFSKNPKKLLHQKDYPESVVDLSLPNYNLPLKPNSISKSITTLELGSNFQHISTLSYIPSSVIQLIFGDNINQLQSYLLNIKSYIKPAISKLIINDHDVSEEFHQICISN